MALLSSVLAGLVWVDHHLATASLGLAIDLGVLLMLLVKVLIGFGVTDMCLHAVGLQLLKVCTGFGMLFIDASPHLLIGLVKMTGLGMVCNCTNFVTTGKFVKVITIMSIGNICIANTIVMNGIFIVVALDVFAIYRTLISPACLCLSLSLSLCPCVCLSPRRSARRFLSHSLPSTFTN